MKKATLRLALSERRLAPLFGSCQAYSTTKFPHYKRRCEALRRWQS